MITVRAGSTAIAICLLLVAGCSREQQDWRSAETADSIDSYGQFIQRHPDSELVTQARARVAQLGEDRDWQRAGSADTVDAYREFITQHPNGKWSQEAHIRIENFSLGEQQGTDAGTKIAASAGSAGGDARGASAGGAAAAAGTSASTRAPAEVGAHSYGLAQPGEAASPDSSLTTRNSPVVPATPAAANGPAAVAAMKAQIASKVGSPTAAAMGAGAGLATMPPTARAVGTGSAAAASAPAGNPAAGSAATSRTSPAPSTPRPAGSATAGAGKGGFGIQLGAYSSEASASAQWRVLTARYASELQGLPQRVVPADTGSGRIYRLQATVGDESRARAVCDQLKKHGQACVAVLPH